MNRRRRVTHSKSRSNNQLALRRRTLKKNTTALINARSNVYRQAIVKEVDTENLAVEA
ncbi:MAG: hypothetical protein ACI8WB_002580 [Phenylobacterium sp.]|jgi:hypothetical protein